MLNQMPTDIQEHIWKTYYKNHVISEFIKISRNAHKSYHLPISVRYDWLNRIYRD